MDPSAQIFFLLVFVLEKAMPYVQIVRAFSSSVIALCKRLYCFPFDVDELFFTTFLQNVKCIIFFFFFT